MVVVNVPNLYPNWSLESEGGPPRKKRTNKGHLIHRVCSFVFIVWVAKEKGESPTN